MVDERILILDKCKEDRLILGGFLCSLAYPHEYACDENDAARKAEKEDFAVAIVDASSVLTGPAAVVERLRAVSPPTVVIIVSNRACMEESIDCFRSGASDYLPKPVDSMCLTGTLKRAALKRRELLKDRQQRKLLEMKVHRRTRELSGMYQETIQALGSALDTRDPETQEHALRVVQYTMQIAGAMHLPEDELRSIEQGAILHDVGKIGVPDGILFKPGKLSPSEWICMKTHAEIGYNMLSRIRFLKGATCIVRSHHERFDGKGYPDGISGSSIPIGARIFAIADALDAMTSDRPYSRARTMEQAVEEVIRCSGSHFDPSLVETFHSMVESGQLEPINAPRQPAPEPPPPSNSPHPEGSKIPPT
ncbi:MAG: HD domain-containing protein [Armatimonadetes bacterium]|nr:HD domain-containing protein [Armatimonadota bacterium]